MDRSAGQGNIQTGLFPPTEPFDQRMLDVGDGHRIYVEQCGNPRGRPAVVLHGGPGGGCSPAMRRYFDPEVYRIVLFDQRGCGRSRPHAAVEANTSGHLVADIEVIRRTLGIADFLVFGGSWGATLALLYAQAHPDRVRALVLRGVFLMTEDELQWFYGGGAGRFWPDTWEAFTAPIPPEERGDLIAAYHRRLFSGDLAEEIRHARTWAAWENALASIDSDGRVGDAPADYARAFARLENHYFVNRGFLPEDGHILKHAGRLAGLPGVIVQGRYDMICPPKWSLALHRAWPGSELRMVGKAGHALSEPGISAELARAVKGFEGV
jgi:proline iminopeptidase